MKCLNFLLVALFCVPFFAFAQWKTQTITLHPGWNAIYVTVHPVPAECDAVFASLPVDSVWAWNKDFSSIQFISDPNTLLPEQPEWLTWFPRGHEKVFLNSLFTVRGNNAYLVHLREDAEPVTLTVTGEVRRVAKKWFPDSYNLTGCDVDAATPPTFASYFAGSPAHAGQAMYTMNSAGAWARITQPAEQHIEAGKAYWVWCEGASDFTGPLDVECNGASGVHFDKEVAVSEIRIENNSRETHTYTVRLRDSAAAPAGRTDFAGQVPLSYWHIDYDAQISEWRAFPEQLIFTIDAGKSRTLRLMVRRGDMPSNAQPGTLFGGLLEVRDDGGSVHTRAITARKGTRETYPGGSVPFPRDGLWVGYALLQKVSVAHGTTTPQPTPAPLTFRLIMHQDKNGTIRLLPKATVMMDYSGDTNMVIITDDSLIPNYISGNEDGVDGQRFSSVVFGMRAPKVVTYSQGSSTISSSISIDYDDPYNPFKHLYHPDHNNLDDYTTKLEEGVQSYDVTRDLTIIFSADPVGSASATAWGDTVVGGVYKEKLQGLYHAPLYVEGKCVLTFVSDVDELHTGQ